jgi:O-Antigen ligase
VTPRLPSVAEWLAIGAGLVVFGYAAWDGALWDARWQVALHLLAIGAIGGVVAMAVLGRELPRTRVDVAALGLLAAFALATASAENHGLALRAMAAIVGTTAMLPVALVVLRVRPSWTALVVIVPTLALAAGGAAQMIVRRFDWYLAEGPGLLPPVRLANEGTPFGSVAVPAFVVLALVPVSMLIGHPTLRRWIQVALAIVAVPAVVLSGSRSGWLAVAVAGIAFLAPMGVRGIAALWPRRWGAREVIGAAVALAVVGVTVAFVAPRAFSVTSLIYRGKVWTDTIAAWSTDPLFGIGPGIMPFARQAAAAPMSFPVGQPHSHNLPLGVLGDAGIVGLVAAAILVAAFAWVAGPWRSRTPTGRAAASVVVGFGVAGLFEDLTFVPGFNLLAVLLVAISLMDAGAVSWVRLPRLNRPLPGATVAVVGAAGAALLATMVTGDAAAIAYRAGVDATARGDWPAATRWFSRSERLDPWHPSSPKSLVVVAERAGDEPLARAAAERAVTLAPGDGSSWANLAILCEREGDTGCASEAADRALAAARLLGREAINAALVRTAIGDPNGADEAYGWSLVTNPLTSFARPWPRRVNAEGVEGGVATSPTIELNRVVAAAGFGAPLDPAGLRSPAVRALAAAILGDRDAAERELDTAIATEVDVMLTWEVALVLRRSWGVDTTATERIWKALRGVGPPSPDAGPRRPRLTYDITTFRAYPLDGLLDGAEHLVAPRPWPWPLEELLPPAG